MRNFVYSGAVLTHTPTSAVAAGGVVVMANMIGVAINDIPANKPGEVRTEGVYTLAKLGTDNIAQGQTVYWDATNKRITTTATANTQAGKAAAAAGAGVSVIDVKINA